MSEIEVGTSMARRPFEGEDLTGKRARVSDDFPGASEHIGKVGTLEPYKYGCFHWYLVLDDGDGIALFTDEIEVLL